MRKRGRKLLLWFSVGAVWVMWAKRIRRVSLNSNIKWAVIKYQAAGATCCGDSSLLRSSGSWRGKFARLLKSNSTLNLLWRKHIAALTSVGSTVHLCSPNNTVVGYLWRFPLWHNTTSLLLDLNTTTAFYIWIIADQALIRPINFNLLIIIFASIPIYPKKIDWKRWKIYI